MNESYLHTALPRTDKSQADKFRAVDVQYLVANWQKTTST